MSVESFIAQCESELADQFRAIDHVADKRLKQVLDAFASINLTESDLAGSTGYGLNDTSRDKLEQIYSEVFASEKSLVRPQIASGTHALACVLFGLLRPGDRVVSITGRPYETLLEVIGIRESKGSLKEFGISYLESDWTKEIDTSVLEHPTKLVMIQRSPGYKEGKSVSISEIYDWVQIVKSRNPNLPIMVDNCYCEFLSEHEPGNVGADLTVGSLIKNPGGGLAFTGGYISGKSELVDLIATRVTAPGIGAEVGATYGFLLDAFRGIFYAPHSSASALKGALLWSLAMSKIGFEVKPNIKEERNDAVVAIKLLSRELFIAFGQAIQEVSPLNSKAVPMPFEQGGYDAPVMLAGGGFISGGTSDLSADGLDKEPFWVYVQGGVNMSHIRIGVASVLGKFEKLGFFNG